MSRDSSIVIVGGGQAGAIAAAELRVLGHQGRLVIVGREAHPPYERPPLSKDALRPNGDDVRLDIHASRFYADNGIELITGCAAIRLDTHKQQVELDDGGHIGFDKCLLATGGQARILDGVPPGTPRVHYVRTRDDALRLRDELVGAPRVAIMGAGFLGLELASTAREAGADVTVLEVGERVLARALPTVASDWLLARARHHEVEIHFSARLAALDSPKSGKQPFGLKMMGGEAIEADLLVVAIGLTPETALAKDAGLTVDAATGGIWVDQACRTNHPAVYAAGDCTSQYHEILGRVCRFESWQNANHQARVAAAAMLGGVPPDNVYPWFWTDQFGCNIQMLGFDSPSLDYVCRGETDPTAARPKFLWLGHANGVPVHGIAVNSGGELRQMRTLFERGVRCDLAEFADTAVPLKTFVKNSLASV